jgi:hypothetical protein
MTFIESLTAIGFGATIFALIVGVFSVWNGRMTRREIIKAINGMDERAEQRHREVIQQHQETIEFLKQNQEIMKKGFGELFQHQTT